MVALRTVILSAFWNSLRCINKRNCGILHVYVYSIYRTVDYMPFDVPDIRMTGISILEIGFMLLFS